MRFGTTSGYWGPDAAWATLSSGANNLRDFIPGIASWDAYKSPVKHVRANDEQAEAGVNDFLFRLRKGIGFGFVIACFYSLYAVGLYLLRGARPFEVHGVTLGATLAAYYVGGIVAGGIIGVLLPLTRFHIGAMLIYSLAAFLVFLSIAAAVDGVHNIDWIGCVILSIIFGVIGSFTWRHLLS